MAYFSSNIWNYSEIKIHSNGHMKSHPLPDGVGTNRIFTKGPRIPWLLPYVVLSMRVATCCLFVNMLSHLVAFCHICWLNIRLPRHCDLPCPGAPHRRADGRVRHARLRWWLPPGREGLAEYCWNGTVWNLEFDETVPLCVSRIYQQIEAHKWFLFFEPTNLDEVSNRIPPTSEDRRAGASGNMTLILDPNILYTKVLTTEMAVSEGLFSGQPNVRQKSTPRTSSWMFSGILQHHFTCQWYVPKDCHLSSGFLPESSKGFSVTFSNEFLLVWILVCIILPRDLFAANLRTCSAAFSNIISLFSRRLAFSNGCSAAFSNISLFLSLSIYIYIYIHTCVCVYIYMYVCIYI